MTVTTANSTVSSQGDGVNTNWPFSFRIPDVSYVRVYTEVIATGVLTLLNPSTYNITGVDPITAGGYVTYPLVGSPLDALHNLVITRVVPYTQDLDITNQDGFYPNTLELQLDLIVMQIQQLIDSVGGGGGGGTLLPLPTSLSYMRWNAAAALLENRTPSQVAADIGAITVGANNAFTGWNSMNVTLTGGGRKYFEIIRHTAPLNYVNTRASFVHQHLDTANGILNELIPAEMHQFNYTGNGVVTAGSDLSQTIWMGMAAFARKDGDGSGHCFTGSGELGAYGPGLYNEFGIFQGSATNLGSLHGTMSGVEMLLTDGGLDTMMHAVIGRINRTAAGARDVSCFFASSEGTQPPNAILSVNNAGLKTWLRGIDFKDAIFTTGQAALFANNQSLAWMTSGGSPVAAMFLSGANDLWITAATTTGNIYFANSALAASLQVLGVVNSVNYFLINGAVSGQSPFISVAGTGTNLNFNMGTKGTGTFGFFTNGTVQQFGVVHIASAVNYAAYAGAVAGQTPTMTMVGTDTNIGMGYITKGTGVHSFYTGGGSLSKQMEVAHIAGTVVNYVEIRGNVTGQPTRISAQGSDTNIPLLIMGKGTGNVMVDSARIAASATAGANGATPAQVSGYLVWSFPGPTTIKIPYYNN